MLNDERNGGQIDAGLANPYKINISSKRAEIWGKSGYVFPEKDYKSIGFQFSGSYSELNTKFDDLKYIGGEKSLYTNF